MTTKSEDGSPEYVHDVLRLRVPCLSVKKSRAMPRRRVTQNKTRTTYDDELKKKTVWILLRLTGVSVKTK